MIKPKDIEKKTMSEEKKREACNSYFAFYVGRPISYWLTVPLLYTNIMPNTITVLSIMAAIMGYICLSAGQSKLCRVIGVFFFFLWNMGDGIDGNIARYKNLKSAKGDLLDTLGGYLSTVLVLLGMGNAAFFDTDGWVLITPVFPVILSGPSAIFTIIPRLLMHRKLAMDIHDRSAGKLKDKSSYSLMKKFALNLCDPAGFQEIIMLISIIFSLNTQFTVLYFILNLGIMGYSINSLLK